MSKNPIFMLVTGDFNARSFPWWKNDLTASEGSQVGAITSSYYLTKLTRESTHILPNLSSCTDLIYINQSNCMDSCVHASLHPICHHQIVHAKLNTPHYMND